MSFAACNSRSPMKSFPSTTSIGLGAPLFPSEQSASPTQHKYYFPPPTNTTTTTAPSGSEPTIRLRKQKTAAPETQAWMTQPVSPTPSYKFAPPTTTTPCVSSPIGLQEPMMTATVAATTMAPAFTFPFTCANTIDDTMDWQSMEDESVMKWHSTEDMVWHWPELTAWASYPSATPETVAMETADFDEDMDVDEPTDIDEDMDFGEPMDIDDEAMDSLVAAHSRVCLSSSAIDWNLDDL